MLKKEIILILITLLLLILVSISFVVSTNIDSLKELIQQTNTTESAVVKEPQSIYKQIDYTRDTIEE